MSYFTIAKEEEDTISFRDTAEYTYGPNVFIPLVVKENPPVGPFLRLMYDAGEPLQYSSNIRFVDMDVKEVSDLIKFLQGFLDSPDIMI